MFFKPAGPPFGAKSIGQQLDDGEDGELFMSRASQLKVEMAQAVTMQGAPADKALSMMVATMGVTMSGRATDKKAPQHLA